MVRQAYEPVPGWGELPEGVTFAGAANAVAVDVHDNVHVFNRGPDPVIVLDEAGRFIRSYGRGSFDSPHAVTFDRDGTGYFVDRNHFVRVQRADGTAYTLGCRGRASRAYSGEPFNCPTDVAIHPRTHELFVSDGYANASIHRYSPDGIYLTSWGLLGGDAGQFSVPHGIEFLDDERIIVCDRENFRLQIFDVDGRFLDQWHAHRPSAVRRSAIDGRIFVAEAGPAALERSALPNLGRRICIYTGDGSHAGTLGAAFPGYGPDQFSAPHGLAIGSKGEVYVAEITGPSAQMLGGDAVGRELPSLRKWRPTADTVTDKCESASPPRTCQ
jgi:hypothetical protein